MSENDKKIIKTDNTSDLFGVDKNQLDLLYPTTTANSELNVDMLLKAYEAAMNQPFPKDFTRIVSPKEHEVIIQMQKEGKLDSMGFPRNMSEAEEYFNRLKK